MVVLKQFSGDELKVMKMRANGKTLQEIGNEIGVSKERVRQICVFLANRIYRNEGNRLLLTEGIKGNCKLQLRLNANVTLSGFGEDDETSVALLGLSERTYNALTASGYQTVGDIRSLKRSDIQKIKKLGNKGIREVCKQLWAFGFMAGAWQFPDFEIPDQVRAYFEKNPMKTPIEFLHLSNRAYRALSQGGFRCVEDITERNMNDVQNLGKGGICEIQRELAEIGIKSN